MIDGPLVTDIGRRVFLHCSSESNPPGHVYWTLTDDRDATVEGTGAEFMLLRFLPETNLMVFCWAEVTLVPTRGERVQSVESNYFSVRIQG